jgi:hypothetical protein
MDAALRCEVCGNDYRRVIQVTTHEGESWFFDSFECAIQMLAPVCARCGTKIMGHGAETADGLIYCGAHCARNDGQVGLVDRQAEDPARWSGLGDAECG